MASNEKTGCSANGINIIDPNGYWGNNQSTAVLNDFFNASNNVPVPNEDLNISVQLETISKSRTILTNAGNSSSQDKVTVSFIDANLIDGKKSLTTNYTLLTTDFDKDKRNGVDENFGITDITIDFDTAYTPMITINFVDVRGSAIFQNDNELNNNKYRVFFDFPYPIYKLTVKGYFGKPVTYCLHMTNFTSKFNSQTGNFEISAKFIGYTYAMLADMIMGYLRAIAYTKVGGDLYTAEGVDNINDFIAKIDGINNLIQGISSTGPLATAKKELERKLELLNDLENTIINFGNTTENTTNSTLTSFNIIAIKNTNNNSTTYNTTVPSDKGRFNQAKPTNISLSEDYTAIEKKDVIKNITTPTQNILKNKFNNPNISADTIVSYYDFNDYIIEIDKVKTEIGVQINKQDKLIIEDIDKQLTSKKFDPTIKYVSNVFVTAIEVFLKTLYKVSYPLENDKVRTEILKSIFKNPKTNDYGKNQQTKYYPWPAYYEEVNSNNKNNYVEKYLGEADGIKNIPTNYNNIGELKFVDELLNSIITSQQIANKQIIQNNNANLNWLPVNPADTRLFINDPPYLRIGNNLNYELNPLILTRAITFLSYSNRTLTEPQIQEMANAEAESIIELATTQNANKIQSLKNELINIINFLDTTSGNLTIKDLTVENYSNKKVLKNIRLGYEYDYIDFNNYGKNSTLVIPLKEGFSNNGSFIWELKPSQNNIFLTNYNSNKINNIDEKKDDGGLYVKIFNKATYEKDIKTLKYATTLNNTITLSNLENNIFDELNPFGGVYGIQEFISMNYGTLGTHDLMYVFYRYNEFNSLSEYRDIAQTTAKTKYDLIQNINIGVVKNTDFTNKTEVNYKYNNLNFTKNRDFLIKNDANGLSYPFIELVNIYDAAIGSTGSFSLFGSAFYYSQSSTILNNYSKALLFLSTLPFYHYDSDKNIIKLFPNEILNLFNQKASFIHAPRLWCALVGGILWRNDTSSYTISNNQIIDGGSGTVDPINWSELLSIEGATLTNSSNLPNSGGLRNIDKIITYGFKKPERDEYLSVISLALGVSDDAKDKPTNDFDILNNLPEQVKKEFKKIFFDFVNGTGDYEFNWELIKSKLEIFDGNDINNFKTRIKNIITNGLTNNNDNIKYNFITSNFKNTEYYQSFGLNNDSYDFLVDKTTAINNTDGVNGRRYFIKLELKGKYNDLINNNKTPVTLIIDGLKEKSIIANNSYRIWPESNPNTNTSVTDPHDKIIIETNNLNVYFKQMYDVLNNAQLNQTNNALQVSFGTDDLPEIKLKIYKYCKNIYDKWISGAESENVIYRCGESTGNNKKLMDSFRFLSRSFQDIGDKFYLDTTEIPNTIRENSNISFYNFYTSKILTDNGFDFIPLPTFINYTDQKEVQDVFKTYPDWYNKPITERNNNCGPTFICVYGGEKSKALDLGDNSTYPNDGFNFDCNGVEIPNDFDTTSVENGLAVFKVNYGQQNQNIFTDIQLDQSEFRETDESLKIQESISNNNANIGLTSVGQNLYNIYNVRSYSSKITMLGNPMIQPMMYYQLNNIPMFKGAYLITNITHDIRPNHMTTTFTGQRIKYSTLPLIDKNLLTTKLSGTNLNNNGTTNSNNTSTNTGTNSNTSGGATATRSVPPIVATIIENGGTDSNIENGNIKFKTIPNINGVGNRVGNVGNKLLSEAVPPFVAMLNEFVEYARKNNYPTINNNYIIITSVYRSYQTQEGMYNASFINGKPSGLVAPAGQSNHAWGIAVDFVFIAQKDGNVLKKGKETPIINTPEGFDVEINPSIKWFLENSYRFGFIIPKELRDSQGIDEFWHFEYHGTSAKCFYEKQPITYSLNVNVNKLYDTTVKNPKDKNGDEARYTSCNYTKANINSGDGTPKNIDTKLIYQELRKQLNYPNEAIAGIMGNMYQESRFIPTATNSSSASGAFGLVQWLGSRKTDFNNYISKNNLDENSYIDQIKFIKYELDNTFTYTKNNLSKNNNVDDATKIFSVTYEATNLGTLNFTPAQVDAEANSDNSLQNRKRFANLFHDMIIKGNFYNLTD